MNTGSNDQYSPYGETTEMQDKCRKYMYHDVILTMKDGTAVDGIIEEVGSDRVRVLVGENIMEGEGENDGDGRQYYGGYGYGGGRPRRRFRRFRRREFPLGALAALALLPYIAPQPYPYYPYPYY
ncbi:hypothetical protein [Salibacterium aidingense]|uniref:hypothetical protein n=1 Tax=Salibacterium aidingense TaxID=384933 RepID=UPI0004103198|nr:hypothetical protein [Salibacterium aidingense]